MLIDPIPEKATSTVYRKLINNITEPLTTLRATWVDDLGNVEDDKWLEALQSPREIAICTRFRLVQLKLLHCSYYHRTLLHKWGRGQTAPSTRGCKEDGSFFHIIWECPRSPGFGRGSQQ